MAENLRAIFAEFPVHARSPYLRLITVPVGATIAHQWHIAVLMHFVVLKEPLGPKSIDAIGSGGGMRVSPQLIVCSRANLMAAKLQGHHQL